MRSTTFILFAVALGVLAVVHVFAIQFFLYWTYLWFDIPMHALGGMVVALGFLTFFSGYTRETFLTGLLMTLGVVLAVGTLWEIFEFVSDSTGPEAGYVGDTVLDFLMDIVGGCIGYVIACVGTKLNPESS